MVAAFYGGRRRARRRRDTTTREGEADARDASSSPRSRRRGPTSGCSRSDSGSYEAAARDLEQARDARARERRDRAAPRPPREPSQVVRRGDRAPAAGDRAGAGRPEGAVRPGQGDRARGRPGGPERRRGAPAGGRDPRNGSRTTSSSSSNGRGWPRSAGDAQALGDAVERTRPARCRSWPERLSESYDDPRAGREVRPASWPRPASSLLRNVLVAAARLPAGASTPSRRRSGRSASRSDQFLRLTAADAHALAAGRGARLRGRADLGRGRPARWDALVAVSLTGQGPPVLFVADGRELRRADGSGASLPFPGGPRPSAVAPRRPGRWTGTPTTGMDLVLAGAGGLTALPAEGGRHASPT